MSKQSDILQLQAAIQLLHQCEAVHHKTVFVDEKFQGQTIWQGEVEVFALRGHPKAVGCFAWLHQEAGREPLPVALLEKWPVNSPQSAVRTAIAFDIPKHGAGGGPATGGAGEGPRLREE